MIIYFPKSVMDLPLIKKAAEMLDSHAELYSTPNFDLKQSIILDPVRSFLSLYLDDSNNDDKKMIDYIVQSFYSVKGTRKVIEFLYKFNIFSPECLVTYKSAKRLEIYLSGNNIKTWPIDGERKTIDYCSEEYINKLREFLKALLYFGSLDIRLNALTIDIDLVNNGNTFGDIDLFIIKEVEHERN